MSYLEFHLIFTLPLILILYGWIRARRLTIASDSIWILIIVALIYTTPWDNYLVARGVWHYPAESVLFRIGYVPFEEYLFFGLETVLVGFWFAARRPRLQFPGRPGFSWSGLILAVALLVAGALALLSEPGTYLGLILVWASLPLGLQWSLAGGLLWQARRALAALVFFPALYLILADWVALRIGIWSISSTYTTGWHLAGMPVEEALFFAVTVVILIQAYYLLAHPQVIEQWRGQWQRARD